MGGWGPGSDQRCLGLDWFSYKDEDFWDSIIEDRRNYDIRLCLFCSFGSERYGVEKVEATTFTPDYISPQMRISPTPQLGQLGLPEIGLFYTKDEFKEVIALLATVGYEEAFSFDEDAKDYVFALTNDHPGGGVDSNFPLQGTCRSIFEYS